MPTWIIQNEQGTIKAEIAPAHGGMVSQIWLKGKEILHLDRGTLETAPMAAGGIPILFPFSSKTKNDTYRLNDTLYYMPMHGLLKNDVFAVKLAEKDRVILWSRNSASWKAQYYPFDFRLEVEYRILDNELQTIFRVSNESDEAMPHYLGWHPFFLSTDKKRICLEHGMQVHYDYREHKDMPLCDLSDLSLIWDDVFHSPKENGFVLKNEADGYIVRCRTGAAFESMVVCSWVPESMCVEPWCGLPDSINTERLLKWIPAGVTEEYKIVLAIEEYKNN